MEYGALKWMSSTPTHTRRLDVVQRSVLRLLGKDEEITTSITSLDRWRDVATLMVCHKAWAQHTPHLTYLSLPPHPRRAGAGDHQMLVFFSTSSQHQRPFKARAARPWNLFIVTTTPVAGISARQTKVAANDWRGRTSRPSIVVK